MATKYRSNINQLLSAWPSGTIAVKEWLSKQGISANLTNWYLKSGWIEPVGQGAYKRAGDQVDWPGGLFAIQNYLGKRIHLGAKSALEIMGYGHYLRLGNKGNFYFFGETKTKMPRWFTNNNEWQVTVNYFAPVLFNDYKIGLTEKNVDGITITISAPERAMMEVLYLIPKNQSLDEAYLIMQGLQSMRPKVVQKLLENCRSVQVKRLFMQLAEMCNLPFVKYIEYDKIDFGKGKRSIAGGGKFYAKYQLSLPKIKEDEDVTE